MSLVYIVGVAHKPSHVKVALASRLKMTGLSLRDAWLLAKGHGVEIPANMVQPVADMVSASLDIAEAALHDGQKYIHGRIIH